MGGAAALLSSGRAARRSAKYELLALERAHLGARDSGYGCMFVGPDANGLPGIFLYKDLPSEAGLALTAALRRVTPQILDWPQYLRAARSVLLRKWLGKDACPPFAPDYTKCVDHFLLHAGGYAVLKGIMAGMKLPSEAMLPSFR